MKALRKLIGAALRLARVDRLRMARRMVREALQQWEQNPDAVASLREALGFDNELRSAINRLAIRAEEGVHPKHRLIGYHDFFKRHVGRNDSVLDIGCHEGALTRDLASATDGRVWGVEIDERSIERAKRYETPPNLQYIHADATKWRPDRRFDVIALSNVLEHLNDRAGFLSALVEDARSTVILIRVPMLERDWVVPMKAELGIESRTDPTHRIEYTEDTLRGELDKAGIEIVEIETRFGEYLCVCRPAEEGGR